MALAFADNSGDQVNFGSNAVLDNLAAGTILFWVKPADVDNSLRTVLNKSLTGAVNGWTLFRRAGDGTQWALQISRASVHQSVDTGSTMQAGVWQFVGFTWSIAAGSPKSYRGTLTAVASDTTNSAFNGTGAQVNDAASALCIGARDGASAAAAPMDLAYLGVWNRVMTLGEIQSHQFHLRSSSGCVLMSVLGYNGTDTQPDWSGNANNGTVSGATVADHVPIPFRRQRGLYVPYAVAAPAGTTGGRRLVNAGLVNRGLINGGLAA